MINLNMTTSTIKIRGRIGGITNETPPRLTYSKIVTRPDGKRKLFSQAVQVADETLLARLKQELREGDEADMVIEQTLGGGVFSVLRDFSGVEAAAPVAV